VAASGADIRPVAVTMGEPAGIGTEILFKAYQHFAAFPPGKGPAFFLIDDPFRVERLARTLGADIAIQTISEPAAAHEQFAKALPVLPLGGDSLEALRHVTPGKPSPATAGAVTASIERAVACCAAGDAAGLVTLPVQKEALMATGFAYGGHTEYLEALSAGLPMPRGFVRGATMLLTAGPFRVAPVTIHMPLREVPGALSADRIVKTGMIVSQALVRDYGVGRPRIVVTGLNPHAGEGGHLGTEEVEIIAPAIEALRQEGIEAIGPVPADAMFHEEARAQYHAALAMYHDQALLPIKTVAFHAAVNTTLGLPIVRTSPDHGTGLDLVGRNVARPDSLINAIYSAERIAAARAAFDQPRG
jgi:4-hydroxythreonine-4-phosphate dehydrogenase